jgi:hypothetical protein
LTNKEKTKKKYRAAFMDFCPNLAREKLPCWFIRSTQHGSPISDVCPTQKAAWASAAQQIAVAVENKKGPYSEVPNQLLLPLA